MYQKKYYYCKSSLALWCLSGRTSAGMILLDLHKLLCSAVIFRLLYQLSPLSSWWRSGRCVLFPAGCVQLQLNSCSDVQPWHTCCVCCPPHIMFQTAHQHKDSMCACTHDGRAHCISLQNWLLGVVVVLDPSATFTFTFLQPVCSLYWISEMSLTALFIAHSWQALMDLYTLKQTSSEATRSPNMRTTPPNNDFTALLFFEKWNGPPPPPAPLSPSSAMPKLKCRLVCTVRILE